MVCKLIKNTIKRDNFNLKNRYGGWPVILPRLYQAIATCT